MATGDVIKLGGFYLGGIAQARPTQPWRVNSVPAGATKYGNIPMFSTGKNIEIRNTPGVEANQMQWVEVIHGGKTLLIADRVALVQVSRFDLNEQSLISGKEVVIDGKKYLLRSLTGGELHRGADRYLGGSPANNEWDQFITNELQLTGLPIPTAVDLNSGLTTGDYSGVHNQKWNWAGVQSIVQELTFFQQSGIYTAASRGDISARVFEGNSQSVRLDFVGWRPVLEVLNTAPTATTIPNQSSSIGVNKTLNLASYFSDSDGDSLTYTTSSSNTALATVSVSGNILTLVPKQIGSPTITVTANDGKGGTVSKTFTFTITNTPPTISGTDRNLGNFALPFTTNFTVNDTNAADSISIKVTLNGAEIMSINGAPRNQTLTIDITKQRFDALAVGSTNTIQIMANDGNGGITYRTLTFVKTNTAPVITGSNSSLGTIESAPTYKYSVTDAEGDAITIIERVNDIVVRTFAALPNTEYTFSISHEEWLQLWPNTAYAISIEATDERGAKSVRSLSFQRKTIKSVITLKNPFETDIHANRIMLNPTVTIPDGAIFKAEACNNAFDDNPNWEDITERALSGKGYVFTFDVKTAAQWGVDLRLTLERGTATSPIILDGFGGAFD